MKNNKDGCVCCGKDHDCVECDPMDEQEYMSKLSRYDSESHSYGQRLQDGFNVTK